MILELACCLLLLQESGQEKPIAPPTEKAASDEIFGIPVHGAIAMKYRYRSSSGSSDNDLYQYLSADFGKPEGRITGHLFLRATEDLDGRQSGYSALNGIAETYNTLNARFYYGHVDFHRLGPAELIRAGRQFTDETPVGFHFDGARVDSRPVENWLFLQGGVYGGIPVHLFESSPRGDYLAGAFAQFQPFEGARVRVDYARVQDRSLYGTERNDLLGLGLWKALGPAFLQLQYNMLDWNSRDLRVRGNYYRPEADLRIEASYFQLFKTQTIESIDLDYFTGVATDYFPYQQVRLLAAKGFGEHFLIQGGVDWRELWNSGDDSTFNRAFRRFYLTPSMTGVGLSGLTVSLTGEIWEVPRSDDGDIITVGLDVTHRCTPEIKLSAGTAYALYKYDYFGAVERENVRTIYLKGTYARKPGLRLDLGYEFEYDEIDTFHVLKFGAGWTF